MLKVQSAPGAPLVPPHIVDSPQIVDSAHQPDEWRRRLAWQGATTDVTTLLLSGAEPEAILPVLVGHAMSLGAAAGATITVPIEDSSCLRVAIAVGLFDGHPVGALIPAQGSIPQLAMARGEVIVIDDVGADSRTAARAPGAGSVVAAPLGVGAGVDVGVLLVARSRDEAPFAPLDVEMIASFAEHAGLAMTLAETRRKRELRRLGEDRERIAEHLSEHAMQSLLRISTTVHGLAARMQTPQDAHRLTEQLNHLDAVLATMRQAIFGLHRSAGSVLEQP